LSEIRTLHVEVCPPQLSSQSRTEIRRVTIDIGWSEGQGLQKLVTFTSMTSWPADDLLESIKKFIAALQPE
jgi:hypothetical protein